MASKLVLQHKSDTPTIELDLVRGLYSQDNGRSWKSMSENQERLQDLLKPYTAGATVLKGGMLLSFMFHVPDPEDTMLAESKGLPVMPPPEKLGRRPEATLAGPLPIADSPDGTPPFPADVFPEIGKTVPWPSSLDLPREKQFDMDGFMKARAETKREWKRGGWPNSVSKGSPAAASSAAAEIPQTPAFSFDSTNTTSGDISFTFE